MDRITRAFFSKKRVYFFLIVFLPACLVVNTPVSASPSETAVPGPQVIVIDNGADIPAEDNLKKQDDEVETGEDPSIDPEQDQSEPVPGEDPVGDDQPLVVPEMIANTGAMAYQVSIAVPPGRNGIEPVLSLAYNSRSGNGWVGVGWHFDVGVIRRSIRNAHAEYDKGDFLHVHGAHYEELVPREGDWGTGFYGAKIEGAFSKYHLDPETGGWVVVAKDGKKYFFGTSEASRLNGAGGIFEWYLDAVEDTNGNRVTIHYALVRDGIWETL